MQLSTSQWLEIGRIVKPHGLQGEVIVSLTTNVDDRLQPGLGVEANSKRTGTKILHIDRAQAHQHRFVVRFLEIQTREQAETFSGCILRAEPLPESEELWVHELIGSRVIEKNGTFRGIVTEFLANPASDLLVLDSGALVPLVFVVERNAENAIVVSVPDGLFELYESEE